MNKLVTVYDFTLPCEDITPQEIIESLKGFCNTNSTFQREKGDKTGYLHYQGRIRLSPRKRFSTMKKFKPTPFQKVRWSITSKTERNNNEYVTKDHTRVEGPWSLKDCSDAYIPKQIKEIIHLYPFQETIVKSCSIYDSRTINIVYDPTGNIGKSIICQLLDIHKKAVMIPPINDYKDVIQYCMSRRRTPAYLIDMPRALNKKNQASFYSALETIKSGFLFDIRYKGKVKHIDRPVMWVFTNKLPKHEYLSHDMWKFHKVVNKEMVTYIPTDEQSSSEYETSALDQ